MTRLWSSSRVSTRSYTQQDLQIYSRNHLYQYTHANTHACESLISVPPSFLHARARARALSHTPVFPFCRSIKQGGCTHFDTAELYRHPMGPAQSDTKYNECQLGNFLKTIDRSKVCFRNTHKLIARRTDRPTADANSYTPLLNSCIWQVTVATKMIPGMMWEGKTDAETGI